MTPLWTAILVIAAGCFALKWAGLSVPARWLEHPLVVRAADLIPVGLLAALIAVQVLATDGRVVIDARLAGLGVAAVLLAMRVPFLPVVAAAAATAAVLRLF